MPYVAQAPFRSSPKPASSKVMGPESSLPFRYDRTPKRAALASRKIPLASPVQPTCCHAHPPTADRRVKDSHPSSRLVVPARLAPCTSRCSRRPGRASLGDVSSPLPAPSTSSGDAVANPHLLLGSLTSLTEHRCPLVPGLVGLARAEMRSPSTLLVAPATSLTQIRTRLAPGPKTLSARRANAAPPRSRAPSTARSGPRPPRSWRDDGSPSGFASGSAEPSTLPSTSVRSQLSLLARLERRGCYPATARANLPPDGFCRSNSPRAPLRTAEPRLPPRRSATAAR